MTRPPKREVVAERLVRWGVVEQKEIDVALQFCAEAGKRTASNMLSELQRLKLLSAYQAARLLEQSPQTLRIGDWVIIDEVARGGMGIVYRASTPKVNDVVFAVKVMLPGKDVTDEAIQRFHNEAIVGTRLGILPNIVVTQYYGTKDPPFIVMEYVEGENLRKYVVRKGPITTAVAIDFIRSAATGLKAVHEKGFIHRDVKPDNLVRKADGTVKVTDFGLAIPSECTLDALPPQKAGELGKTFRRPTGSGKCMGTKGYISPEQARNSPNIDLRTDVYALGWTILYLLTASDPEVAGTSPVATTPPKIPPHLPADLALLIKDMTAHDPDARPTDMSVVLQRLDAIELSSGPTAIGLRTADRRFPFDSDRAAVDHGVNDAAIERWLDSFKEHDRLLCRKLLDSVLENYFLDEIHFGALCTRLAAIVSNELDAGSELPLLVKQESSLGADETIRKVVAEGIESRAAITELSQLTAEAVAGRTIVVIDDVCWTGKTGLMAVDELVERAGEESARNATLVLFAYATGHDTALKRVTARLKEVGINGRAVAARTLDCRDDPFSEECGYLSPEESLRLRELCQTTSDSAAEFSGSPEPPASCPVVCFYGPLGPLVPILRPDTYSGRAPLFGHLRAHDRSTIPSIPHFVNRDAEVTRLEAGLKNEKRSVLVGGDEGMGKTHFVAHFVSSAISGDPATRRSRVFWHRIRRIGTFQHFVDDLAKCLDSRHRYELSRTLRMLPLLPQTIAEFILQLPSDDVIVVDRADELAVNTGILTALSTLLARDRTQGPVVIAVGVRREGFEQLWQGCEPDLRFELDGFDESGAQRQTETIWHCARTRSDRVPALDEQTRDRIVELGHAGDPLLTSLAASLALARHRNGGNGLDGVTRSGRHAPQQHLLKLLWNELEHDTRLYLATASCFIPPRFSAMVDTVYRELCARLRNPSREPEEIRKELLEIGDPFFRMNGRRRTMSIQMTPVLRRVIQSGIRENYLSCGIAGVDFQALHSAAAWLFIHHLERHQVAFDVDDTARIVHAYRHLRHAGQYDECADLIRSQSDRIFSSNRLNVFESLIDSLLSDAHQLSIRQQMALVLIQLKLLQKTTQHERESAVTEAWLRKLPESLTVERVWLLSHVASSSAALGNYVGSTKACEDALKLLDKLDSEAATSITRFEVHFVLRARILARFAQTAMTLARYPAAWERLQMLSRKIHDACDFYQATAESSAVTSQSDRWPQKVTHAIAILFRHLSTLTFLMGEPKSAAYWIGRCRWLNENHSNSAEGLAICDYKSARIDWLTSRLSENTLSKAIKTTEKAYQNLIPRIHASRWWKGAFLEQIGSLHIDRSRLVLRSGPEDPQQDDQRNQSLEAAEKSLRRAKETLTQFPGGGPISFLIRRSELKLLEAKLAAERNDQHAAIESFEELVKLLSANRIPYLLAIVRYEYCYYLYQWDKTSASIRQAELAISSLIEIASFRTTAPILRRQYMQCSLASRRDDDKESGQTRIRATAWAIIAAFLQSEIESERESRDAASPALPNNHEVQRWKRSRGRAIDYLLTLPVNIVRSTLNVVSEFYLRHHRAQQLQSLCNELLMQSGKESQELREVVEAWGKDATEAAFAEHESGREKRKFAESVLSLGHDTQQSAEGLLNGHDPDQRNGSARAENSATESGSSTHGLGI